jgi:hypothetical protein
MTAADGIPHGSNWNVPALSDVQLNATGGDDYLAYSGDPGTNLSYTWTVLSSACEVAEISNTSTQTPTLSLNNLGSFEVRHTPPSRSRI